ncbi:hypothetical protein EHS25_007101 [Saitozyma podzolica]|uniref:Arsenical-resistance protein n=1 Tax=Saitozyma podzolica TaxID=1890683 RepID=A0A427XPK6_9TREE|nr:hypothetical protein EHS25_007101 [Saitozyma podzolica]
MSSTGSGESPARSGRTDKVETPAEPPQHGGGGARSRGSTAALVRGLSWLDRLLAPLVLVAMVLGVVIGKFAPNVETVLTGAQLRGVSIPIMIGLLVMMWPILTKVQYERLHLVFKTPGLWQQLLLSLFLNWVIGPFVMLALAWATLPDLPTYRTGVILVGIARCIAMVMIWNQIAQGSTDLCAILVIINSILQIALYSPLSLLMINVISNPSSTSQKIKLDYGDTAIAVLIYLGIPLVAGVITRFSVIYLLGKEKFESRFLPCFGPLALIGLLYTIILIFAEQATHILDNLGPVFRVFVPLILYFVIMWTGTFVALFLLGRRERWEPVYAYQSAVVQSFTAGSNNFELAIAVCIAVYGVNSDQALAATIGPLVEVPVLLSLSYVSLLLKDHLKWGRGDGPVMITA